VDRGERPELHVESTFQARRFGIGDGSCLGETGLAPRSVFHRLYESGLERDEALRQMTVRYRELMHGNEPVHDWPVD
jgi:hypothetical protein